MKVAIATLNLDRLIDGDYFSQSADAPEFATVFVAFGQGVLLALHLHACELRSDC